MTPARRKKIFTELSRKKSRVAACGKITFFIKSDAKAMAKKLGKLPPDKPDAVMREYWCERCEGWHTGHSRFRKK